MTFTTLSFSSPVTILSAQCFGYELISETERLQILPDQGRIVPEINRSGIHTKFLQGRRPLRGLTDSFLTLFLGFRFAPPQALCHRPLRGLLSEMVTYVIALNAGIDSLDRDRVPNH
jgi:hypothetical protein